MVPGDQRSSLEKSGNSCLKTGRGCRGSGGVLWRIHARDMQKNRKNYNVILTIINPFSKTRVHRPTPPVQDQVLVPGHGFNKNRSYDLPPGNDYRDPTLLRINQQVIPEQKKRKRNLSKKGEIIWSKNIISSLLRSSLPLPSLPASLPPLSLLLP